MKSTTPAQEFKKLLNLIETQHPDADLDLLKLAYEFALEAHQGQTRATGEPYILHPLAVSQKLAQMQLDIDTIIAGILHDVPEDTERTLQDVEDNFGKEIASLVEGITKLGKIKYRGMERYVENLRKMFMAMSRDIRVIFIKFADRIHNLQTLDVLPPDKQLRIARESLEIYGAIAGRLGMGQIKGELEDLSFKYVYPKDYLWLTTAIPERYQDKERHLKKIRHRVAQQIAEKGFTSEITTISGRTKHLYSLYRKLLRPEIDRDLSKIYDLIALRIIVPTVSDCYSVLGILHTMHRPMPNRIKDYIAQPKPNGYQSLHTTVFADNGEIVEFQIRTPEMHQAAEFGVAAHWGYKENRQTIAAKNIKWLDELADWQHQTSDHEQFLKTIKFDIFNNRIFVFTPKGDVIDLPENATPVDFAYHVHTSLGDSCTGARVNNQLVSLSTPLRSGDVIEIIRDKNRSTPNLDWLKTVKTSMARSKIKEAQKRDRKSALSRLKSIIRMK
jgi:GTP pyrophosphokinase